jgi:DNA-binding beta-propeller fold protein YncE
LVGQGEFRYRSDPTWRDIPQTWAERDVSGITIDADDNVFVLCPDEYLLRVYRPDGASLREIALVESSDRSRQPVALNGTSGRMYPHSVTVTDVGTIYWVDMMRHAVHGVSDGAPFLAMGLPGVGSETGSSSDFRAVSCSAGPFNGPTKLAVAPSGDLYVADGYRNARVHCFSPGGDIKFSWGNPGSAPGQFMLPHSVAMLPGERVVVADRENNRLQFFDLSGRLVDEWRDVIRPTDVVADPQGNLYVAELGLYATSWTFLPPDSPGAPSSRCTVFSPDGEILARWGSRDPEDVAGFFAPHCVAVDSHGDIYLGEVNMANRWTRTDGLGPHGFRTLHKFVRV